MGAEIRKRSKTTRSFVWLSFKKVSNSVLCNSESSYFDQTHTGSSGKLRPAVKTAGAAGGVAFHMPVWYACRAPPTPTHLVADWLAFLPRCVIMALPQASQFCSGTKGGAYP